ncbi:MAG: class I SAM-dependent methyltransferase [bacterium]
MPIRCPACGLPADSHPAGQFSTDSLAGWQLLTCPTCTHSFCQQAFGLPVDYDEVHSTQYLDQSAGELAEADRHQRFILLPPYLAFHRNLGRPAGRLLLDVGCGAGRFLLGARGLGWKVIGSEPSARAVATARSCGLEIQDGNPADLPEASVDVLCLFDVIEHLAIPGEFLAALLHLVRPGGYLFLSVPNWDCELMRKAERADWLPPVHLQFFTAGSLATLLSGVGAGWQQPVVSIVSSDPQPPLSLSWTADGGMSFRSRFFLHERLRWQLRRLRRLPSHPAQLAAIMQRRA